jgi:hypothetical protein
MTSSDKAESALANEVTQFVADARGMSPNRILPTSRLLEDLGLDGDDALELMLDFFARFHVSKGGFVFNQYFGPEAGWSPLAFLWRKPVIPITIQDLIDSATAKAWKIRDKHEVPDRAP